jgi:hypothetical protein
LIKARVAQFPAKTGPESRWMLSAAQSEAAVLRRAGRSADGACAVPPLLRNRRSVLPAHEVAGRIRSGSGEPLGAEKAKSSRDRQLRGSRTQIITKQCAFFVDKNKRKK